MSILACREVAKLRAEARDLARSCELRLAHKKPGDTYFRAFGTIIGLKGLTTVFGMGTGVALSIWSPGRTRQRR